MNISEFAAQIKTWDIEKIERYIDWTTEPDVAEFRAALVAEKKNRLDRALASL